MKDSSNSLNLSERRSEGRSIFHERVTSEDFQSGARNHFDAMQEYRIPVHDSSFDTFRAKNG